MAIERQHIIDEIRRTAAENGGVPPGRQRFFGQTGIRESDWLGIHWVRWSEALSDAGFAANEFQAAYEAEDLLQRYAELAMELGRLPVNADLRMRARSSPGFPHESTFRNRLTSKQNLVTELSQFCQRRLEFQPVVDLCNRYSSTHRDKNLIATTTVDSGQIGFVYLMKSGRYYKIGHSNAAGRREYELAIQLPEKLATVHAIRTDDPTGIESYWHNRFQDKRKNGEWFDLTSADIAAFKRRKFM